MSRSFIPHFLLLVLVGLAAHCSAQDTNVYWVGTWASAPQLTETRNLPPPPGLTSNTLRQVVHVSIGGKRLRLRFSNAFGNSPVMLASAHVASSAGGGAIKPETDRALMFQGRPATTIPPGETVLSDAFDFEIIALSNLAVTLHFGETSTNVTGHPGSRTTSYLQTGDANSVTDLSAAARTEHWYIFTGIDVVAAAPTAAVAILGDSITDGRGSTTDGNNRWPDNLSRRLQANAATKHLSVLNQGIGGNCVLRGGLGPPALSRFERDVLAQDGVRWLIILEGVNDIGGSRGTNAASVAQELIAAYERMIVQAHKQNIRAFGGTILPFGGSFYFSSEREAARQTVNDWIRTSGKFDAMIDFDAALRDPKNSTSLVPAADGGDHLHPSIKGYEMMAAAIDLKLFTR